MRLIILLAMTVGIIIGTATPVFAQTCVPTNPPAPTTEIDLNLLELNGTNIDTNLLLTIDYLDSDLCPQSINSVDNAGDGSSGTILWEIYNGKSNVYSLIPAQDGTDINVTVNGYEQVSVTASASGVSGTYYLADTVPPYIIDKYTPAYVFINKTWSINITWVDSSTSVDTAWLVRNDTNGTYYPDVIDGNVYSWTNYNETQLGEINITAYANDTNGNINSTSFIYTVIGNLEINLESPTGDYYNITNITISGKIVTFAQANVSYVLNNGSPISLGEGITEFSTNDSAVPDQQNNLTVYAVNSGDPTDNASKNVSFYVDMTKPSITYNPDTTPFKNNSQNGILINVSINETNLDTDTVTLYFNGTPDTNWNISGTNYWWNKTNLSEGDYSIRVYATDLAGNKNVTAEQMITLDMTDPSILIASPTEGEFLSSSVDLNYSLTEDNLEWVGYSLDGGPNVSLSGNTILTNLVNGKHNVTIYANDSAGNSNSMTRNFIITWDIEGRYENDSVYIPANEPITIDVPGTNAIIVIVTNTNVTGGINITLRSSNPIGTSMTDPALDRYLAIDASDNIEGNLTYAVVRFYYTDAEVSSAGIFERSMRLYKWNGSEWVRLVEGLSWVNSAGVDRDNNFIWANVTSLSDYTGGGYVPPTPQRAVSSGSIPPKTLTYAILTTSEDWRYAMMAAGFAAANNYILITTPTHSIDLPTRNNLKWFDELWILGNNLAISKRMEDEFKELRMSMEPGFAKLDTGRVGGVDYFDTALQLAKRWKNPKGIIVVRGDIFPDALVAGQLSAATDSPILFTMPGEIWASELELIKRMKLPVTIIGGETAVSTDVEDAIKATGVNVRRIGGKDRYETAALVGDEYVNAMEKKGKSVDTITFLSGETGEWASTLGFRSYVYNSTILYTRDVEGQSAVPTPTKNFVAEHPYISSASIVIKDGARPKGYEDVDAYLEDMQLSVDPVIYKFIMDIDPDRKDYAIDTNPVSLSVTVSQKVIHTLHKLGVLYRPLRGAGGGGGSSGTDGGGGNGGGGGNEC